MVMNHYSMKKRGRKEHCEELYKVVHWKVQFDVMAIQTNAKKIN